MDKTIKILVVCGGISSEREVSLRSGHCTYEALVSQGFTNVTLYDMTRDNMTGILDCHPDIVFLALHGKGGEDGTIQGMLELAGIPYTGPGVASSAVCMNKVLTKRILSDAGLPTARFAAFKKGLGGSTAELTSVLLKEFPLPMVLKPSSQGSSIGVHIIKEAESIPEAITDIFSYGDELLAEEYLNGVEITLPIMGNDILDCLPIIEISSDGEFYDYDSKYTPGVSRHIIPACIDKATERMILETGKKAYQTLGCTGYSNIDFIVDIMKGPMIVEVNTLPGLTDMSLLPDAARYTGISYAQLVERILELGINTHRPINA